MKRPNPLSPFLMTPVERRTELCGLLSLGLVRLRMRDVGEVSDETGENLLHLLSEQSGSPGANHRRPV